MVRSRAMAALAPLLRGATFLVKCGLPVRCFLPTLIDRLMTVLAGFRSYILGTFGGRRTSDRRAGGGSALIDNLLAKPSSGEDEANDHREKKNSRGPGICLH